MSKKSTRSMLVSLQEDLVRMHDDPSTRTVDAMIVIGGILLLVVQQLTLLRLEAK